MGVLPLTFKGGQTRQSLRLTGSETIEILGLDALEPRMDIRAVITRTDGNREEVTLLCRIDTANELEYYHNGGILQHVIRHLMRAA
jgi:aconitate hydratase